MSEFAVLTIDGVDYFTCPSGHVDRDLMDEAFTAYNHYQKGFLPHAGGIYDQPERLLRMIEVIGAVKSEIEDKE